MWRTLQVDNTACIEPNYNAETGKKTTEKKNATAVIGMAQFMKNELRIPIHIIGTLLTLG